VWFVVSSMALRVDFSTHPRSLLPVITVAMLYADLSFEAGIVGPFEAIVHSLPQLVAS